MGRERDNGSSRPEDEIPRPHENLEIDEKPVDMVKDWSTDYFPTSARPIFIGYAILAIGVLCLCWAVYYLSPHPVDPLKLKKQAAIKDRLNVEEDDE